MVGHAPLGKVENLVTLEVFSCVFSISQLLMDHIFAIFWLSWKCFAYTDMLLFNFYLIKLGKLA